MVDPGLRLTDGVVTIRRMELDDLDMHLSGTDEEQIRWLWLPGQHEQWEAMTLEEQRAHQLRWLVATRDGFGPGPKWCFAADIVGVRYLAYVDCDLDNENAPAGEANISYACHPAHRGLGYVSRAVRLILEFLRDNTSAPRAHIVVDAENGPSLGVARAVGAVETERWINDAGRTMVRHAIGIRR